MVPTLHNFSLVIDRNPGLKEKGCPQKHSSNQAGMLESRNCFFLLFFLLKRNILNYWMVSVRKKDGFLLFSRVYS